MSDHIPHSTFCIDGREVGPGNPTFVIAEVSANHNGSLDRARQIVHAAAKAGADAVKFQTYTPDTMTLEVDRPCFRIGPGTIWQGRTLHDLYAEAMTPWEWHAELMELSRSLGLVPFSTAFDASAVAFLEELGVGVHKIASFELVDIPLIETMAATGKPLIISTGMGTEPEIAEAMQAARSAGAEDVALLHCVSAYPAPPEQMNLRAIGALAERFGVVAGLSDHSPGIVAAVASVGLGSCILEKHLTISRGDGGPDAAFSLEPRELAELVSAVRKAEAALGDGRLGRSEREAKSLAFRRSLFVVEDIPAGEPLTAENIRAIRPGDGLAPKHYRDVLGRTAARELRRGTPLSWDCLSEPGSEDR